MSVTFHVEIDKSTEFSRATQKRPQLGREMGNCISRIGRTHLRIECRNFDRKIYNRKKLRIFAQRIGPVFRFARQALQQIQITCRIFIRFRFADDSFSQKIDGKPNFLRAAFAQGRHYIVRIFSGDELARHSGDVPAQDTPAYPGNDAYQANAGANKRGKAVARIGEIFLEMLNNFA